MSSHSNPQKTGGLWGRLFGVNQKEEPTRQQGNNMETAKVEDVPVTPAPSGDTAPPLAEPVPLAMPLEAPLAAPEAAPDSSDVFAAAAEVNEPMVAVAEIASAVVFDEAVVLAVETEAISACPACTAPRKGQQDYCDDCGFMYPAPGSQSSVRVALGVKAKANIMPGMSLNNRYEIGEKIGERGGVARYRGTDHGNGQARPVIIVTAIAQTAETLEMPVAEVASADDDIMPTFEDPVVLSDFPQGASWPSIGWEKAILEKAEHPAVPGLVDHFVDGEREYLIEEVVAGRTLWDAWDDPDSNSEQRYGWLKQIAEGLHALHQAGAMIEGIRPGLVTVTADGQAAISDLADLLPIPVPADAPMRASLYTAPELILSPQDADARADLYSFGAMIYALEYLHHDPEERDFERQFSPKQITEVYPDVHPLLLRLINKTFVRDPNLRFPTDEASRTDASGFTELIQTLEVCQRTFDIVRLDFAAWTTTGMVRTGNEDALAFLHTVETRQDDLYESAIILLCDGMGGYEAGEIAAAMTISEMRKFLLEQPMFAALAGKTPEDHAFNLDDCKKVLVSALKYANKQVHTASRTPGKGKRGMGCTAEAVFIDNRRVVVGHVGDSRTYHLHQGRLIQLTRDQTLVNRLVELGQLTEEEAEDHPRKNELQQAIGGQPDVNPGVYSGELKRGDWVIVCSDGLTNHIPTRDLEKMLTRETAGSAEEAARRLLNLVNLRGATDNATIVVVRAS